MTFPLWHMIVAELVAMAAALALARLTWWAGVIAAIPVFIVAGLHYRGSTATGWLGRATQGRTRPTTTIPKAFSVELPGVGPIGMRWDGQYAITAIALHGRSWPTTLLVPEGADTLDTVPLEVIGDLLHQFGDLELDNIDVVSAGSRVAPDGRYTPHYDAIIGDRPAVGQRRTWLVLRLCPQACLKALAYRSSPAQASAAATERIRQAAVRAGCRANTCSAEQLDAVTSALLGGQELDQFKPRWSHLRAGNDFVTSYRIAGTDLTSRLLCDLWTIRS
ncbi:MAG: type VII secretion protein EccE, partial [Mycolicibacterium sp.]|nr:type VII secretion protein EccE [Mycolicibacterium sp.]